MERKLSTLELTVLGLAYLRGPCTIYSLMKELSMSESSFHKSRAGAAYSVAKRLIRFQLLKSDSEAGESRVSITEKGTEAVQAWLSCPIPMQDVAHSADLIRLRCFFLSAVSPAERIQFVDGAVESLKAFLEKCEALLEENEAIGDYFGVLATLSTVLETRARIKWLLIIRELVQSPLPAGQPWSVLALELCNKNLNLASDEIFAL